MASIDGLTIETLFEMVILLPEEGYFSLEFIILLLIVGNPCITEFIACHSCLIIAVASFILSFSQLALYPFYIRINCFIADAAL